MAAHRPLPPAQLKQQIGKRVSFHKHAEFYGALQASRAQGRAKGGEAKPHGGRAGGNRQGLLVGSVVSTGTQQFGSLYALC